ncbi:hypothetical protein F4803DRAFT_550455 [Xylaria telfairii]|nr:hypothetical protein F4803DRAFT_550455 [Xylaria telfairii]
MGIDTDTRKSSFGLLSAAPSINELAGTSLNPIVLDDDANTDSMAHKSTPKRKPTSGSPHSQTMPKKRRLISVNNEPNNGIRTPRPFVEIVESEDKDKVNLQDEVLTLQAEVSRLKTKLEVVESDRLWARQQLKDVFAEKLKHVSKIQQLEENLQKELVVQRQAAQKHTVELAETKTKLQNIQIQAARNGDDVQRLGNEINDLQRDFAELLSTKIETEENYGRLTAELERTKQECVMLPGLRSKLMITETQLSTTTKEAHKKVSGLQSQLKEVEESKTILRNRVIEIERVKAALEEENKNLVASSKIAIENSEKIKSLELSLDSAKRAHESARLERLRTQEDLKKLTEERSDFWRRITIMETKGLENKKREEKHIEEEERLMAELTVTKQKLSRLNTVESSLQTAQQYIEAVDYHMGRCPFVQKTDTDIWDNCVKSSRDVSEILAKISSRSDKSPGAQPSSPRHIPSPRSS